MKSCFADCGQLHSWHRGNAFSGRSDSEHVEGSLTRNEIDGLEVLMAAVTPSADDDDDEQSMAGALIDLQGQ
ncbi:hypothetical protein J1N35_029102 [Gossypium stocksii]|uniref:Uncharacterized protein n=1 Tax=Gossypium stocksii TaxID=47602 RepID=A0A9D3UXN6_9ROSI|nr:hypothetical protein J1N35_029102 [Gossypium stocksii]